MSIRSRPFRRLRLIAMAILPGVVGCAGSGLVQMVPGMRSDIPPDEPLIGSVQAREAWYWKGEKGDLNIVLARRQRSPLNAALDSNWVMSIVLEDLPAGRERLYRVGTPTFRVVQSYGVDRRRARSLGGVVVIERAGENRIRGRFHVLLSQQQFTVLNGWSPPLLRAPVFVTVGRFEAVLAPDKGTPLLKQTEADGFDRASDLLPATRPMRRIASRPATATAPLR
jgi:hypothetical protein